MDDEGEIGRRTRRIMDSYFQRSHELAETPIDIGAYSIERHAELDDHLWLRTLRLVPGATPEEVERLPVDVRAYCVTRLFEWEVQSGGPDAFFDHYGNLARFVAAGYLHLGLGKQAALFERLRACSVVERPVTDPGYVPSDDELLEISALSDAIGSHDGDRLVFVRSRPSSFSI